MADVDNIPTTKANLYVFFSSVPMYNLHAMHCTHLTLSKFVCNKIKANKVCARVCKLIAGDRVLLYARVNVYM